MDSRELRSFSCGSVSCSEAPTTSCFDRDFRGMHRGLPAPNSGSRSGGALQAIFLNCILCFTPHGAVVFNRLHWLISPSSEEIQIRLKLNDIDDRVRNGLWHAVTMPEYRGADAF